MHKTTSEQVIEWLGLRFAVPGDWQLSRHAVSPQHGGLVLVDRYRQRMQLNWTAVPRGSDPDITRMVEDYQSKQLEAEPAAQLHPFAGPGDWMGVRRVFRAPNSDQTDTALDAVRTPLTIERAVRYDAPTGRVLEAIFEVRPGEEQVSQRVLASIEAPEPIDAITRVRAFDIEAVVPPDWRLTQAQAKPADVTLRFKHFNERTRATRQEMTIRRMGMADSWWHGDGERYIRGTSPRVKFEAEEGFFQGRRVTRAVGIEDGPRGKRLLGLLRRREELLWHDAAANAVFHMVVLSWSKWGVSPDLFSVRDAALTAPAPAATIRRAPEPQPEGRPALPELLAAVPVVNAAVHSKRNGKTLILYVPIRKRWWMGPPFCWMPGVNFRDRKGVALDALGQEVWKQIDGRRSVEQIVDRFAAAHRLRFHEARISVMSFLQMLMQRGLIAVVGKKEPKSSARERVSDRDHRALDLAVPRPQESI